MKIPLSIPRKSILSRLILLTKLLAFISFHTAWAQTFTEGFEDEKEAVTATIPGDHRSFSQAGFDFETFGRIVVFGNDGTAYGASNSNYYMHARPTIAPQTGTIGGFSIKTSGRSFQINSFAAYVASDVDGENPTSGNVTFTATLPGGGKVSETIFINSLGSTDGYDMSNAFVAALKVQMSSIEITLSPEIRYIDIDQIQFTTIQITPNQYTIDDVTRAEGNSNTTTFIFTVSRSQTTAAGSVNYTTVNNTALSSSDYYAASGTVHFLPGQTSSQIAISVRADLAPEANETFFVVLSSPVGGVLADERGTGKILDDDASNETFENETASSQRFTENGTDFNSTDNLRIKNLAGSGSGSSDYFLDNGSQNGMPGGIQIQNPNRGFRLYSLDIRTSPQSSTPQNQPEVVLQFTGLQANKTIIALYKTISASESRRKGWIEDIGFANTPFDGALLLSLEVAIVSGTNYIAIDNFRHVSEELSPEIRVSSQTGQSISNGGSNSPSVANLTDFGGVCRDAGSVLRTFTINNSSTEGTLLLNEATAISLSGPGAQQFNITSRPASMLSPLTSTSFSIRFNPTVTGRHSAVVTIISNDTKQSPYTFNITGLAYQHPASAISAQQQVCISETIQLQTSSQQQGLTYLWEGNGINKVNAFSTTASPNAAGIQIYRLTVTNENNCSSSSSKSVQVLPVSLPAAQVSIRQDASEATVFANSCEYIAKLVTVGSTPLAGVVTMTHNIETNPNFQFVGRHYEFAADQNFITGSAEVVFYFTQQDFDAYNAKLSSNFLPGGPSSADRSNIQIAMYEGSYGTTPAALSTAAVSPTMITPTTIWNQQLNLWEVSLPIHSRQARYYLKSALQPLPVTLVSFKARKVGISSNQLSWQTTHQTGFSHFEVTSSKDAVHFERIGFVKPDGQTTALRQYQFIDNNASVISYYRLRMVDNDGSVSLSRIISVNDDSPTISVGSIYPNPATADAQAKIDVITDKPAVWTLRKLSVTGQVVSEQTRPLKAGINTLMIGPLNTGINLIELSNGSEKFTRKVIRR